ncbi:glycosyl transferase, partial [Acinetobacter baumannii]
SIMQYILKLCEIININFSHRSITITQSMKQLLGPLNYKKKEITALIPGTLVGVKIPYSSYTDLQSARALLKTNSDNSILKILYVGRLEHRKG